MNFFGSTVFDYRTAVQAVTPGPISGASTVQDINAGLVDFMTLKNKDGLSAATHAQTDSYSLIKIRQHRQISLRERRLKGKGKGVLSAKETRGGAKKNPFPSLPSACHAGHRRISSTPVTSEWYWIQTNPAYIGLNWKKNRGTPEVVSSICKRN